MTVQRKCRVCGLVVLHAVEVCPACLSPDLVPAGRDRDLPTAEAPPPDEEDALHAEPEDFEPRPRSLRWVTLHRCPNEFVALTLQAELERAGIVAAIRSLAIPGYPGVGLSSAVWGLLLVDEDDLAEAAALVRPYLDAVEGRRD